MKRRFFSVFGIVLLAAAGQAAPAASKPRPLIGESEHVFVLAPDNTDVRGLAFDEISPVAPRLFVLDKNGKVFVYRAPGSGNPNAKTFDLLATAALPPGPDGKPLRSPRGLAFAREEGADVLYYLNWNGAGESENSQLWRWKLGTTSVRHYDLSLYPYRVGNREVLALAFSNGKFFIAYDASNYKDGVLRVQRGILLLQADRTRNGDPAFVRHLPDSGKSPSLGLAVMDWDGARYLWSTVGAEAVYCADETTGRGIFHFDRPMTAAKEWTCRGLAFGQDGLWVPESAEGPDLLHRVNVTKNLEVFPEGPRILRHLIMTIESTPEGEHPDAGTAYHYYSRPYSYGQLFNQGIWPETEKVADLSAKPLGRIKPFTYDPAGDVASRQHMSLVEYPSGPAASYSSRYEIDLWTNPFREYIYPHRADRKAEALKGLNYLADDPELFNLADRQTYDELFARVRKHIEAKYGAPADLENPYWAARNVLEYYLDNYYYPSRPKQVPAAVDYGRAHYDANPGNLKIELSAKDYDKTQIIACSGTSVMLAGAMRYLGISARWLGTGTEQGPDVWDKNKNGFLDADETAPCTSGHRYTQVWLGGRYGWVCFDATPTKPDDDDYDVPPPLKSQWMYMNRAAAGHLKDKRIVFNIGSGLFRPLYRDFEYDEELALENNCGGDQRYNLQGKFDKPELWKLARNRIEVRNICFIENVKAEGPKEKTTVTWSLGGAWDKDTEAKVMIAVQKIAAGTGAVAGTKVLARGISPLAGSVGVDLKDYSGSDVRLRVYKEGDAETGGATSVFRLD